MKLYNQNTLNYTYNASSQSAQKNYTALLTAGKKYRVSFDFIIDGITTATYTVINGSNTVGTKLQNVTNHDVTEFTATNTNLTLVLELSAGNYGRLAHIDNLEIAEIAEVGESYRFGFNGQEKDNEVAGAGNTMTAMFWEYDARLGRRWNVDPKHFPWESAYSVLGDNPLIRVDFLGDKWKDPKKDGAKANEIKRESIKREKILRKEEKSNNKLAEKAHKRGDTDKETEYRETAKVAGEGVEAMQTLRARLDEMGSESTSQAFTYDELDGTGFSKTYMDASGVIHMQFRDLANAVHESTHGYQHLTGDLEMLPARGTDYSDIGDEIAAYKMQFYFSPSSVLSIDIKGYGKIGSFKMINSETIRKVVDYSEPTNPRYPYEKLPEINRSKNNK